MGFAPFYIAVIILSNSIAHTFLDIIPSIFLGAPEADTALAGAPGSCAPHGRKRRRGGASFRYRKLRSRDRFLIMAIPMAFFLPEYLRNIKCVHRMDTCFDSHFDDRH